MVKGLPCSGGQAASAPSTRGPPVTVPTALTKMKWPSSVLRVYRALSLVGDCHPFSTYLERARVCYCKPHAAGCLHTLGESMRCAQSAPLFFTISPLICGPRTVPPAIGRTIRDTAVPWTFGIGDAPGSISATIRYINSRCGRRIGGSPDEKSLPGEGVLLGAMLGFGLLMKRLGVC